MNLKVLRHPKEEGGARAEPSLTTDTGKQEAGWKVSASLLEAAVIWIDEDWTTCFFTWVFGRVSCWYPRLYLTSPLSGVNPFTRVIPYVDHH